MTKCPDPEPRKPPPPYRGKASLCEAFERITRAGEHLAELKALIGLIKFKIGPGPTEEEIREVAKKLGPHRGIISGTNFATPDIPMRAGTLIGETCNNLRSALDYLVFNLSALDSGLDYQGTQFPIEDRQKDFRRRVEKRGILGGMNATHQAAIEGLQPYKGSKWSKTLKEISNPDKHRGLTVTAIDAMVSGTVMSTELPDGKQQVHTTMNVGTLILFGDGKPVIQTLEELRTQVSLVLESFNPDFN
jgi:hypothetical protein